MDRRELALIQCSCSWHGCVLESLDYFAGFHRFFVEEYIFEFLDRFAVGLDDHAGAIAGFCNKRFDFLVDKLSGVFGILTLVDKAFHHHAFVDREYLVAKLFTHTLVNNHVAGNFGRFAQVITATGSYAIRAKENLFGNTTTHGTSQHILELDKRGIDTVFGLSLI